MIGPALQVNRLRRPVHNSMQPPAVQHLPPPYPALAADGASEPIWMQSSPTPNNDVTNTLLLDQSPADTSSMTTQLMTDFQRFDFMSTNHAGDGSGGMVDGGGSWYESAASYQLIEELHADDVTHLQSSIPRLPPVHRQPGSVQPPSYQQQHVHLMPCYVQQRMACEVAGAYAGMSMIQYQPSFDGSTGMFHHHHLPQSLEQTLAGLPSDNDFQLRGLSDMSGFSDFAAGVSSIEPECLAVVDG